MDKAKGADIGELGFDPDTFATALMTLEAVSYTHLDVYKRQTETRSSDFAP